MKPLEKRTWLVIAGGDAVRLHERRDGSVAFSCTQTCFERRWRDYFDLCADYRAAIDAVPPEDEFLRAAVRAGCGLRILRQDPWEMLISFIISQRKTIPAIRDCIERLCALCGKPIRGGYRAFPTPRAMARLSEEQLRACGVGYRAPYLHAAACRVAGGYDLSALSALPDEELYAALLTFPGVGIKVAQCVMLFGYHRLSAAPVDVWIQRVIDGPYGGCSPFPGYGENAGLYQQYLFYYQQHVLRP